MKIKSLLLSCLAGIAALTAHATHYEFYDETVLLSDSSGGTFSEGTLILRFGAFAAGFTPDALNTASWESNWIAPPIGLDNGFLDPSAPEWNAYFNVSDNALFAQGVQLHLWIYNPLEGASGEWALFTDSSWLVGENNNLPSSTFSYSFTVGTQSILGEFDFVSGLASTGLVSAVPEPASFAFIGGAFALGLSLVRRRRRG